MDSKQRLIIAITGASGVIFGVRILELLSQINEVESHLVLSPAAVRTLGEETDYALNYVCGLAGFVYKYRDIGAAIASGSFRTQGMIIAPCSVKTLSGIANCSNVNLIQRAADVCLKERRRLVLLFRETPLHNGHITLMHTAISNGAVIMPPIPAFYHRPRTIEDIVNQTAGRALDLFDIDSDIVQRWQGCAGYAQC